MKWRILIRMMSKTLLKIVAYNNRSGNHFQIAPNKRGRDITLTWPCAQVNHSQNITSLHRPHPSLPRSRISLPLPPPPHRVKYYSPKNNCVGGYTHPIYHLRTNHSSSDLEQPTTTKFFSFCIAIRRCPTGPSS